MFRTASPSTEVAQSANSKNTKVTPGRSVRAAKAGLASVFAMGLLSVAAMPAYAESSMADSLAFALKTQPQALIAAQADNPDRAGITVESVLQELEVVEEPATEIVQEAEGEAEEAEVAEAAPEAAPQVELPAIPSGSKSAALVRAAFNQLGVDQDCTDAVQNALAEIGLFQRRDQGGFDLGPMAFAQFGTQIDPSQAAPGDILLRPGHVFVYTGNNTGIHGGWPGAGGGLVTTTDSSEAWSSPYNYTVIRLH